MIEKDFDVPFIAGLALREKQIQQDYRPIIAVHKWFARRPGTLFRGLILSEFAQKPLHETFYHSNHLSDLRIADPFMGGGTPLLEANRLGCDVIGLDINPMAYWIVKQEIEHLDIDDYTRSAYNLRDALENEIGRFYRTHCVLCGAIDAHVKYFLWVKSIKCKTCRGDIDLFPSFLLAANSRHPKNVFVCPSCGQLTESEDRNSPGLCQHCHSILSYNGPAKANRCKCSKCGTINEYPDARFGPPVHRLFALEYYCPACKEKHIGRYFKVPDSDDLSRIQECDLEWAKIRSKYVPGEEIPSGDETNRLHRWGYKQYQEMFNVRQLLGLELSAQLISRMTNDRIRNALATNLSDLLRYQNMLCRYDTMALKSLDIFSIHGFPVSLVQCESNILGIIDRARNTCIGSGGWSNIIKKFRRAKAYCNSPYEVKYIRGRKKIVPIAGEWIGDCQIESRDGHRRIVDIRCEDSTKTELPAAILDAVFTDPPYFGNVQYAELMDFCYVWLRRLLGWTIPPFDKVSTRNAQELTGNEDMRRGLDHFGEGLSAVFQRMAASLKPGAPLVFTYHHNDMNAYIPIAVGILDAGLTCSASLPCPAEMGASIHINRTGSSIIDTVFVCRSKGIMLKKWMAESAKDVANIVLEDIENLRAGSVKPTLGDTRCIAFGHLIRLAIWALRKDWDKSQKITKRMAKVQAWLKDFGEWREVEKHVQNSSIPNQRAQLFIISENQHEYGAEHAEVPF
jgi:adenine-specific DNA methylase